VSVTEEEARIAKEELHGLMEVQGPDELEDRLDRLQVDARRRDLVLSLAVAVVVRDMEDRPEGATVRLPLSCEQSAELVSAFIERDADRFDRVVEALATDRHMLQHVVGDLVVRIVEIQAFRHLTGSCSCSHPTAPFSPN
jgi:hypothetical protein